MKTNMWSLVALYSVYVFDLFPLAMWAKISNSIEIQGIFRDATNEAAEHARRLKQRSDLVMPTLRGRPGGDEIRRHQASVNTSLIPTSYLNRNAGLNHGAALKYQFVEAGL